MVSSSSNGVLVSKQNVRYEDQIGADKALSTLLSAVRYKAAISSSDLTTSGSVHAVKKLDPAFKGGYDPYALRCLNCEAGA
jgi:hypothetical protein